MTRWIRQSRPHQYSAPTRSVTLTIWQFKWGCKDARAAHGPCHASSSSTWCLMLFSLWNGAASSDSVEQKPKSRVQNYIQNISSSCTTTKLLDGWHVMKLCDSVAGKRKMKACSTIQLKIASHRWLSPAGVQTVTDRANSSPVSRRDPLQLWPSVLLLWQPWMTQSGVLLFMTRCSRIMPPRPSIWKDELSAMRGGLWETEGRSVATRNKHGDPDLGHSVFREQHVDSLKWWDTHHTRVFK